MAGWRRFHEHLLLQKCVPRSRCGASRIAGCTCSRRSHWSFSVDAERIEERKCRMTAVSHAPQRTALRCCSNHHALASLAELAGLGIARYFLVITASVLVLATGCCSDPKRTASDENRPVVVSGRMPVAYETTLSQLTSETRKIVCQVT